MIRSRSPRPAASSPSRSTTAAAARRAPPPRLRRLAFPAAAAAAAAAVALIASRSPVRNPSTSTAATPPAAAAASSSMTPPPPSLPYLAEAEAAAEAVRLASKLCERVQATLVEGEETKDKADDSPVTVADYGAQALVAWSLTRAGLPFPFSMVAEEDSADLRDVSKNGPAMATRIADLVNDVLAGEGLVSPSPSAGLPPPLTTERVLSLVDLGGSEGGSEGKHWVLDPIDGTRGFVGRRQYAVCLALLDRGQLAVGVLGCPNVPNDRALADGDGGPQEGIGRRRTGVGALFWATSGGGCYVQPLHGDDASPSGSLDASNRLFLSASSEAFGDRSRVRFMESYDSRHSDFSTAARLAAALRVTSPPLRLDSQAKYGCLSRGDAAINLRFPRKGYREKIWDHAAGVLLVKEAGGITTDASGRELDFGRGRWLDMDRGIVTAASRELHAELVEALRPGGAVGDA